MTSLVDGEPALTNDRTVFTVVSPSEVYSSVSRMNVVDMPWHEPELSEFAISGNVFSFTDYPEEGVSVTMTVRHILLRSR